MISDAEAQAAGLSFSYSLNTWSAIHELVNKHCSRPANFDYWGLLQAANDYLRNKDRERNEMPKRWKNVARLMARACQLVAWDAEFSDESEQIYGRILEIEQSALRCARYEAARRRLGGKPREEFFLMVFECWGDAGGQFKRSRTKPNEKNAGEGGKAGGPTVRYFDAAVRPVMGGEAPGPDRVCQLIVDFRGYWATSPVGAAITATE